MKKIHILGVAVVAMLAFGVVGAVSASAATLQWLAEGKAIVAALASEAKGELLQETNNGAGLGIHVGYLCSGIFDGTVGPGAEENISGMFTLTGVTVTLAAPILNCVVDQNCTEPEVSPVNFPWLGHLELMGTEAAPLFLDALESGGQGSPGWEITCLILGTTVTEVCTGGGGANLTNDVAEKDVLAIFEDEVFNCSIGGNGTGLVETDATDEAGLIMLSNGNIEALSVGYE
jgi:hypothetical protein